MSENVIQVQFGASTAQLKSGVQDAARALEDAARKMAEALQGIGSTSDRASKQVRDSMREIKEESRRSADALDAAFSRLKGLIAGLGAGYLVKQFVDMADAMTLSAARLKLATASAEEFERAQKAVYDIAQQNNIGLREASELYTKLAEPVRRMGGTAAETTAIVDAFSKTLRISGASAAEASAATLQFAQAMASGKLQGDEFRSMAEASPRFMRALADGMGVPIEALKTMGSEGRLTADVVGNALIASLGKLRAEAAGLPDTVGGAMTRLKNETLLTVDAFNRLSGTSSGIASLLGAVTLAVRELGAILRDLARDVRTASSEVDHFDTLIRVMGTIFEAVVVLGANVAYVFNQIGKEASGMFQQLKALAALDFKKFAQIGDAMKDDAARARAEIDAFSEQVLGLTERMLAAKRAANGMLEGGQAQPNLKVGAGVSAGAGKTESRMGEWEAQIAAAKVAYQTDRDLREMSKQEEIARWREVLAAHKTSREEGVAIERKIASLNLGIMKEAHDFHIARNREQIANTSLTYEERIAAAERYRERIKYLYGEESAQFLAATRQIEQLERERAEKLKTMAREQLTQARDLQRLRIEAARDENIAILDMAQEQMRFEAQMGEISAADLIQIERDLEQQRYQIRREAMERMRELIDPARNPVEYARVSAEIEALERQHQASMADFSRQVIAERRAEYDSLFASIESGMASTIANFVKQAQSWRDFMQNMLRSVLGAIVDFFAQWMAREIIKSTMSRFLNFQEGASTISTQAAKAGAAGVASMAAAPFPLNAQAPAFGASMFAAAMAYQGALAMPAAEKGFDIPAGINPITQLHEREMVLPAQYADVIRGMADGGAAPAIKLEVHESAMRYTLNDWLQGELARLAATR